MTTTLNELCLQNQALMGPNFDNLGKKTGILLRFDAGKGWAIEKFEGVCGFFKWILRYFGFYQSTRLSTIRAQIQKELVVDRGLRGKIEFCWMRRSGENKPIEYPPINEAQIEINPPYGQRSTRIGGALFTILQGDITRQTDVKSIVNAANQQCLGGGGVDGAIQRAAGPELFQECLRLPVVSGTVRCPTGEARITGSGNLRSLGIQRVIHTAGPIFNEQDPAASERELRASYISCLDLARQHGIRSVALPSISTGNYRYEMNAATQIAYETIEGYLNEHPGAFNQVKIVYYDQRSYDSAAQVWDARYPLVF